MSLVLATPVSSKAKNRFCNLMSQDPVCVVEQVKGDKLFLRSANNRYHFWVNPSSDPHWSIDWCWESVAIVCGGCSATDSHSQQGFYWFSFSTTLLSLNKPALLILNKTHPLDSQKALALDSQQSPPFENWLISAAYHVSPACQGNCKIYFCIATYKILGSVRLIGF